MKTLLVMDVGNIQFNINKKFGKGYRLDYTKYIESVNVSDINIISKTAYGTYIEDNVHTFQAVLNGLGFEIQFKKVKEGNWYNWDTGIAVDVLTTVNSGQIQQVMFGTSSIGLIPLFKQLKKQGIKVIIYGCGISKEVEKVCNEVFEFEEDKLIKLNT